mmetsp:Transcript_46893/g.62062  ORF Transcript_46893/g.62062 Transcript_46893/m.62062 type:complete len:87 (+) Transcript_46893:1091-1351(+)
MYTKTESEGAPLGYTSVSRSPCTDPLDVLGFPVDDYLYSLEWDQRDTECKIDLEDVPAVDPRYRQLGTYQVSQFDLQTSSGVLAKL